MKRLNVRLTLWLVGITLVLVVSVHLLHGYQLERNADFLKGRAENAVADNDSEEAIKYYNQYLKYRDDRDGYSALAELVFTTAEETGASPRDWYRAYTILEEAIRRHEDLANVRRRLIEYTMMAGRYTDSLDHIRYLNEHGDEDPKLEVQKAQCYFRSGEEASALKTLYGLVGYDQEAETFIDDPGPGAKEIEAFELLAGLLRRKPEGTERADEVMDRLVALNPDSAEARLTRANYISTTVRPAQTQEEFDVARTEAKKRAKVDLDKAFAIAPDDADVMLAMAGYAMSEQDYVRTRELLDKALADHPERQEIYLGLAQLATTEKNPKAGIEYLKRGAEEATDVQMILPQLLQFQLQEKDLVGARATCKAMDEHSFANEFIRFSEAQVTFAENSYWKAARELEAVRPAIARGRFAAAFLPRLELLLSSCYELLGMYDRQLEVARRVLQRYPGQAGARLSEAHALQRLGRYDEADITLQLLAGNVEQFPALAMPVFQLARNDQSRRPAQQRDWTFVNELAEKLYADPARSPMDIAIMKAGLLMEQNQLAEAQEVLRAARQQDPKDVRVWSGLAKLLLRLDRVENVGPLLEMAEKQLGDVYGLRAERLRLLNQQGGDNVAGELQKLEQNLDHFSEPERVSLMTQLGATYLRIRDYEGAKRVWQFAIDHDPRNAATRQILFELMSDTNDVAGMKAVLKNIEDSPNWGASSPLYKYCKAMLLIKPLTGRFNDKPSVYTDAERKSLNDASRLVNEAKSVRGEWASLWRVRAEIDQLEHNFDGAIAAYQRALECSQSGQTVVARRLVRLLSAKNRFTEANEALKYIGELSGTDPLAKTVGRNLVAGGQVAKALEMARKDVEGDPDNPANHIWLAHVLEQDGKMDEAQAEYRKAVKLGPNLPYAWMLLVRHLVANKKTADAADVIRQGAGPLEKNPRTMAQLYELVDDAEQAEHFYQVALEAEPDDPVALQRMVEFYFKSARAAGPEQFMERVGKARPYLDRIVETTKNSTDPASLQQHGWARRTQAEIIAAGGTYENILEAAKLIERNARDGALPQADIAALVNMLAKRPETKSRAKAVRLLEDLKRRRPLGPRERLLLGQLYERAGDWTRARDLMLESLTTNNSDPEMLIAFVRSLINHSEYDEATRWLDTVDELLPKIAPRVQESFRASVTELRARLLVHQGQPEQAVAMLEQLVPSPLPPNQLDRLRMVSMLMEQLGQFDAAQRMLEGYAQQEPRGVIALAAFLGRRGEIDKAFAMLEDSRGNQSVTEIAPVALEALRNYPEQATPERFQTLEGWAKEGLQTEPDPSQIKLLLAEIYDAQGRYDDVVTIYREVLAAEEDDSMKAAVVKNNLAFVLALTNQELPEALRLINESIKVIGPRSDLLDTRGMVYLKQGNLEKAIADLRLSASNEPSVSKYFHLADAEKQANHLEAARDALAQAEQLGDNLSRMTPLEKKRYQQLVDELK